MKKKFLYRLEFIAGVYTMQVINKSYETDEYAMEIAEIALSIQRRVTDIVVSRYIDNNAAAGFVRIGVVSK